MDQTSVPDVDMTKEQLAQAQAALQELSKRYEAATAELRRLRKPETPEEGQRIDALLQKFSERAKEDELFYELAGFAGEMRARATAAHEKSEKLNATARQIRAEFLEKAGLPKIERPKDGLSFCVGSSIDTGKVAFTVGQMLYQVGVGQLRRLVLYDLEGKARTQLVLAEIPAEALKASQQAEGETTKGGDDAHDESRRTVQDAPEGGAAQG